MTTYAVWRRRTISIVKTQRMTISGLDYIPRRGAVILAPNHLNWKDIFLLAAMIPRQIHFVATYELFDAHRCASYAADYMAQRLGKWCKVPATALSQSLGRLISHRVRALGAIPVKRGGLVKRMFSAVEAGLKSGQVVCIFPEGGTGVTGRLREFKKGLSKVVLDLWNDGNRLVPVLPIAITGTDAILCPCRRLFIRIAPPLHIGKYISDSQNETLNRFTRKLRDEVARLLSESHPHVSVSH